MCNFQDSEPLHQSIPLHQSELGILEVGVTITTVNPGSPWFLTLLKSLPRKATAEISELKNSKLSKKKIQFLFVCCYRFHSIILSASSQDRY
jgi:hypothetical protein